MGLLDARVDMLAAINERLMQSVYWTLGTLSTIFLGLISVNLYFNISGNRRELQKIKEGAEALTRSLINTSQSEATEKLNAVVQAEITRLRDEVSTTTASLIASAEASITEKVNANTRRELDKEKDNILNLLRNEMLNHRAELASRFEKLEKNVESLNGSVKGFQETFREHWAGIKELEAFRYSQKGLMGAIYRQIDLLEYDLEHRGWNLESRLRDLHEEMQGASSLQAKYATKLKELLKKIKEQKYADIVKKIQDLIVVEEEPGPAEAK